MTRRSMQRVVQDLTAHPDPAAGHAILCRVRVPGRGGAGPAPQHHEASLGFCMPAQRWKSTSITSKAWRREHLNVTLFDETEMEQEEPPEETDPPLTSNKRSLPCKKKLRSLWFLQSASLFPMSGAKHSSALSRARSCKCIDAVLANSGPGDVSDAGNRPARRVAFQSDVDFNASRILSVARSCGGRKRITMQVELQTCAGQLLHVQHFQ